MLELCKREKSLTLGFCRLCLPSPHQGMPDETRVGCVLFHSHLRRRCYTLCCLRHKLRRRPCPVPTLSSAQDTAAFTQPFLLDLTIFTNYCNDTRSHPWLLRFFLLFSTYKPKRTNTYSAVHQSASFNVSPLLHTTSTYSYSR